MTAYACLPGVGEGMGWWCAAGILEAMAYTTPCSTQFFYPIYQTKPNSRVAILQKQLRSRLSLLLNWLKGKFQFAVFISWVSIPDFSLWTSWSVSWKRISYSRTKLSYSIHNSRLQSKPYPPQRHILYSSYIAVTPTPTLPGHAKYKPNLICSRVSDFVVCTVPEAAHCYHHFQLSLL